MAGRPKRRARTPGWSAELVAQARARAAEIAAEVDANDSVSRVRACRDLIAEGMWITGQTGPWLAAAWGVVERTVSHDVAAARILLGDGAQEACAIGASMLVRAIAREEALAEAIGGRLARDAEVDEPAAVRDLASAYRSVASSRERSAEVLVATVSASAGFGGGSDDDDGESLQDYTDEELRALAVLEARKARLQQSDT